MRYAVRYAVTVLILCLWTGLAQGQSFYVEQSDPAKGASGVSVSDTVAFAFNASVNVSTDWNTAFVYRPGFPELRFNQVSLCINFRGDCGGGDNITPRFVRFRAEHQPNTDYTWLVYAVKSSEGNPMTEPYVLRYSTAPDMGQGQISGAVAAPKSAARWTPAVRASLRALADGLKRNGLGRPIFDRAEAEPVSPGDEATVPDRPKAMFGTMGTNATASDGPFTQILLLDAFSIRENNWTVRAADALIGSSGAYSLDFVRPGSYVPIAVRYTDGTNTEIDALGFHDPDGDGTPNTVEVDGDARTSISLELFDFPLTTARNAQNLAVARDSAARYAPDQQLKLVQANYGTRPAGTAYEWTFRFHSPQEGLETSVTINPLDARVDTSQVPAFLMEMNTVPDGFVDSDAALQAALDDGGQDFIEPFRLRNLTTIVQGGNLYWTDTPVPIAEFWRVRIIGVTSSRVEIFERYIDMGTGEVLQESDPRGTPDVPTAFSVEAGDGEVAVSWDANVESDLAEYRLYRSTTSDVQPDPSNRVATISTGTTRYTDTGVDNRQAYYYRLTAADSEGNESAATSELAAFPLSSTVDVVADVAFGPPDAPSSYRLVALPGGQSIPLASTFDDPVGQGWMAYWDDGSTSDFLVKYDGSSTFNFQPGRGFWVISQSDWSLSRAVQAVNLADEGTYAIDVHDGWNIVSNPLDVEVSWGAVQAANEVTQALWAWDGGFSEASAFASAKGGQAYYFLNEQGLDALTIPYPGAPGQPTTAPKSTEALASLTLTAHRDGEPVAQVRAGVAPDAAASRDPYDQFAPPGYFESAHLRLVNDEVDPTYTELAAEYRAAGRAGYTFDLTLASDDAATIQLQTEGLEAFPDRQVLLINPKTARTYDLHARAAVTLRPESASMPLKLVIGDEAYAENAAADIVPDALALRPNYPNPFHEQTTLEYALPEQQDVRLVIYDVLGRRIRTLVATEQRPGLHHVLWDGRNDAGQPVSSGVYLSRLTVDGQTKIQRLVLVR